MNLNSWIKRKGLTIRGMVPQARRIRTGAFRPGAWEGPAGPERLEDRTVLARLIDGIDINTTAGPRLVPPDPSGAAGINHVLAVVNSSIQWYDKTTGSRQTNQSLASFFSSLSPGSFVFDPKAVYDPHADRFVAVALEQSESPRISRILVAVSRTGDPNQGWNFQAINGRIAIGASDTWVDYPGLAVDSQAIYITGNQFAFQGSSSEGNQSRLWIAAKTQGAGGGLYGGGSSTVTLHDPSVLAGTANQRFTLQPAMMYGTAPSNVGTFLVSSSAFNEGSAQINTINVIRVNNPLTAPTFTALASPNGNGNIGIGDVIGSNSFPNAPQGGGTGTTIRTNDPRMLSAVWRNDRLYAAQTINPSATSDPANAGQTTAHWYEVNTANLSNLTLTNQGNVGGEELGAGTFTYFPAIAVNPQGDVALTYTASSSTRFASMYATGRRATDPADFMQPGRLAIAGTGVNSDGRWGDYSAISPDPNDPEAFWAYHEYAKGTIWGTAFYAYKVRSETIRPLVASFDPIPTPRTAPLGSVTIRFSEPVYDVDAADLRLTRNGGPNLLTAAQTLTTSDGGLTWILGNLSGLTTSVGIYSLTVNAGTAPGAIVDLEGNFLAASASVGFTVAPPQPNPSLNAVIVNDGSAQRSLVARLTVQFDQPVSLGAGALQVIANGPDLLPNPGLIISPTPSPSLFADTYVITFTGAATVNGSGSSLRDGNYLLNIQRTLVVNAINNSPLSAPPVSFHRFYGDVNGDREVSYQEYLQFRDAYINATAQTLALYDVNGDRAFGRPELLAIADSYRRRRLPIP